MLRKFRQMNIDYEMVGFYQAHPFGACFTQELVESMYDYQCSFQDGVVLIYGEDDISGVCRNFSWGGGTCTPPPKYATGSH